VTERWRKKLEGIDQVAPRDDVYERAKAGPRLPEAQSPMQRTSTRVATAIAAFVVFALAISLFVVPTLRLRDDSSALSAGGQLLPLWPARTVEQVQALQDEADAGQAGWALDPRQVGTRFGQAVLGWPDAWAGGVSSIAPTCGVLQGTYPNTASPAIPCAYAAGSNSLAGVPGADPGTDMASCDPAFLLCGQATGGDPSSGPPSPFISLAVAVCDPSSCHASPTEMLELFQPIGTGDDRIWAVFEASSPSIDLAVSPGQTVREGSSISTGARIRTGAQFGLGVHVGASESCSLDKATDVYHGPISTDGLMTSAGSEIGTDFGPSSGTSCQQSEPGYVFAATSGKPIVRDGVASDPLQPGGASLYALSAVPITFEWPDGAASSGPPTPTTSTGWTTYTDPLGWTIDVPTTWVTTKIEGSDANTSYAGAAFGSATLEQDPGGPITLGVASGEVALLLYHSTCVTCPAPGPRFSDDSDLPLALSAMDTVDGGYLLAFQADGIPFTLRIRLGGNAPTTEQLAILQRMVSSIHFVPWHIGEQRDGWTALNPTDQDPLSWRTAMISWQSCNSRGCYVLTFGEPDGEYLLGPMKPCGEGENMTADAPHATDYVIVLECPNGSTQRWTRTGAPAPTNSTGYDAQLEKHPVVKAWDGSLLANVDETIG
jgi:hypothetical protein